MSEEFGIGKMDRSVTIQSASHSKTTMGAPNRTYTELIKCRASRTALSGSNNEEQIINRRIMVPGNYIYRIHYKSGIDETCRLVDSGLNYNIISIAIIGMKRFLDLTVEQIID